jgi:hypothetical protein
MTQRRARRLACDARLWIDVDTIAIVVKKPIVPYLVVGELQLGWQAIHDEPPDAAGQAAV